MTGTVEAKAERLEVLDALRGVASLAVVLFHLIGLISLTGIEVGLIGSSVVRFTSYGHLGVPVFFVLSGYVIAMTAERYRLSPGVAVRFVLRRMIRIAPPYWAMILLITSAIILGQRAGLFQNTTLSGIQVFAHIVYLQDILGFKPLDMAYWTLCLEIQFYIVFASMAVLLRGVRPELRAVAFGMSALVSLSVDYLDLVPQPWFPKLWFQFASGVLAFYAMSDRTALVVFICLLSALISVGNFIERSSDFVVCAVGVITLIARRIGHIPSALLFLGRISYSLYLVHGFIGLPFATLFRSGRICNEMQAWMAITTAIFAAISFAALFYYLWEKRWICWSRLVRIVPE